jgi:hypothetical protein
MSIAVEKAYMEGRHAALQEVVDGIDTLLRKHVFLNEVARATLMDIEDALREKITDELSAEGGDA